MRVSLSSCCNSWGVVLIFWTILIWLTICGANSIRLSQFMSRFMLLRCFWWFSDGVRTLGIRLIQVIRSHWQLLIHLLLLIVDLVLDSVSKLMWWLVCWCCCCTNARLNTAIKGMSMYSSRIYLSLIRIMSKISTLFAFRKSISSNRVLPGVCHSGHRLISFVLNSWIQSIPPHLLLWLAWSILISLWTDNVIQLGTSLASR